MPWLPSPVFQQVRRIGLLLLLLCFACCLPAACGQEAAPEPAEKDTASEVGRYEWSIFAGNGGTESVSTGTAPTDRASSPTEMPLRNVYGIEVAPDAIYFSTVDDHSIWRCDRSGRSMQRIAGTGRSGYSGDGGPALEATFNAPHEIRADGQGNLFVADTRNHCIRKINLNSGLVETVAGDGMPGFRGDGGPAREARFDQPHSIVLDGKGGVLVADTKNHRLRRIDLSAGTVRTVSGNGERQLPQEGDLISNVSLFGPRSLAVDEQAIWLVLREGNSVWRIDRQSDRITRVAGTGQKGHGGDGGDPLSATFRGPKGIAVDSGGRLLIVDTENHALRRVDPVDHTTETLGTGFRMKRPHGTAVLRTANGEDLYLISDSESHRVLACPVPRR